MKINADGESAGSTNHVPVMSRVRLIATRESLLRQNAQKLERYLQAVSVHRLGPHDHPIAHRTFDDSEGSLSILPV